MPDYCLYSELPVDSCHHCQPAPTVRREHRPVDGRPFIARYQGTCPGCGFSIEAGRDRVTYRDGRLVHDDHRRCRP